MRESSSTGMATERTRRAARPTTTGSEGPAAVAEDAGRVARSVSDLVGDGCVAWLLDGGHDGSVSAVAVEHREREGRDRLAALLGRSVPLQGGWAGHALDKGLAFAVRNGAAAEAVAGRPSPEAAGALGGVGPVHGAVVAPLRLDGEAAGVLVALRDTVDQPYTLREQRLVGELAMGGGSMAEIGEPSDGAPAAGGPPPPAERVLQHSASGVWVTDMDGVTTYVNGAVSELVGVPSSRMVGAPMTSFIDDLPQMVHAGLSPQPERRDHRLLRPDGEEAWVSVASVPLTDEDGRRRGTVSTLTEIGERKRMEVELRLRAAAHQAVAELAERALAGDHLEELMEGAAATAADVLCAEYGGVCEVARDRRAVIPRAVVGWDAGLVGRRLPLVEHSPEWLSLEDDEPVSVNDCEALRALEPGAMPREAGVRSTVCVRIGDGLGVLCAHSPRPDAFRGRDLSFMRLLAGLLAGRWQPSRPALAALPVA